MTQFLKRIAIVTLVVLMCLTGLNTQVKAASPTDGDAYAILTDQNELIFFRSTNKYEENEETVTVTDINGKNYTGIVFTDVEQSGFSYNATISGYRHIVTKAYVADNTVIKPKDCEYMFGNMYNMKEFNQKGFDTSETTNMSSMFFGCNNLTELDLSSFDTSKVTDFRYMFDACNNVKKLNISSFDTSSAEETEGMFPYEPVLEEIVLGPKFTKWMKWSELPRGRWTNGSITLTAEELREQYPANAANWAGTWKVVIDKPTTIYLTSAVVEVGQNTTVSWYWEPYEYRIDTTINWTSSDESVVMVDNDGYITGIKPGVATITATTTDGSNVSGSCKVRVVDSHAYAILLSDGDLVFFRGNEDHTYLDGISTIRDTNGKEYKGVLFTYVEDNDWGGHDWTSDRYCKQVKKAYVAEGYTIYPTHLNNYFVFCENMTEADLRGFNTELCSDCYHLFAQCRSLVKVDISSFVTTSEWSMYNMFGECQNLEEVVLGPGLKYWEYDGKLPRGNWTNGSITLTAEELREQYPANAASWAGTWTRKFVLATDIKFTQEEYETYLNTIIELPLVLTPSDATPMLEWEIADPEILELWDDGSVSGRKLGTTTVTVRTTDGSNLSATCTVHVIPEPEHVDVTGFKFTKKEYEVPVNRAGRLEYEITPEGADPYDLIWESSDEEIAEVYGGTVYPNKEGTVTITVKNKNGTIYDTCTVKITKAENYVWRVYGDNRYKTSMAIAEAYRDWFTDGKVDNVILACGTNFADALAGSYLSAVKYAPIIIINDDNIDRVKNYVKESVEPDGTVYILGGNVAVSEKVEKEMKKVFKNVKRLAGSNRYGTNLEILKEAGMNADSILVATGNNFADSLSASAAGLPMLLVKDSLNSDQKAFLEKNKGKKLYILGGTSAVSSAVEKELKKYGEVKRVAGASRFETSIEIAKTFFDEPYYAMFAYSNDYPDGLCGGPIGVILGSPLILTRSDKLTEATKYCKDMGIVEAIVFGGEARLTNNDVKKLLNQKSLHFEERKYEGK